MSTCCRDIPDATPTSTVRQYVAPGVRRTPSRQREDGHPISMGPLMHCCRQIMSESTSAERRLSISSDSKSSPTIRMLRAFIVHPKWSHELPGVGAPGRTTRVYVSSRFGVSLWRGLTIRMSRARKRRQRASAPFEARRPAESLSDRDFGILMASGSCQNSGLQ